MTARIGRSNASTAVLVACAVASACGSGCRRDAKLGDITIDELYIGPGMDSFNNPRLELSFDVITTKECGPKITGLTADIEGIPMKRESAGGSHLGVVGGKVPTDIGTVCDAPLFVLDPAKLPPAKPEVTFHLRDGSTTLSFVVKRFLDTRELRVSEPADGHLRAGKPFTLTWSPASDQLGPLDKDLMVTFASDGQDKRCEWNLAPSAGTLKGNTFSGTAPPTACPSTGVLRLMAEPHPPVTGCEHARHCDIRAWSTPDTDVRAATAIVAP